MINDAGLVFATAQADVRSAGSYLCQKSIPLGSARGAQMGDPLDYVVRVGTAFAGGTSVEFQLVAADDAALATNLIVLESSSAIAEADLKADTIVVRKKLPQDINKAFLGIRAVGVGTHTAGDFDAFCSERAPMSKTY